jgi:hypothetical protein
VDIEDYLAEMIRRASLAAADARREGRQARRRTVLWQVPWQFIGSYIVRLGWLDGWAGLHASCLTALAVYLRETKLWEMQQQPAAPPRGLVRDTWQPLRIFNPNAAEGVAAPEDEPQSTLPSDAQPMRRAA